MLNKINDLKNTVEGKGVEGLEEMRGELSEFFYDITGKVEEGYYDDNDSVEIPEDFGMFTDFMSEGLDNNEIWHKDQVEFVHRMFDEMEKGLDKKKKEEFNAMECIDKKIKYGFGFATDGYGVKVVHELMDGEEGKMPEGLVEGEWVFGKGSDGKRDAIDKYFKVMDDLKEFLNSRGFDYEASIEEIHWSDEEGNEYRTLIFYTDSNGRLEVHQVDDHFSYLNN